MTAGELTLPFVAEACTGSGCFAQTWRAYPSCIFASCSRDGLQKAPKRRNSSTTSKASSNAVSDSEQAGRPAKSKSKTAGKKSAASAAFGAEEDYGISDPLLAAFVRENYRPSASSSAPAPIAKRASAFLDDDDDDEMLPEISQAYASASTSKKPLVSKPQPKAPAKLIVPKKRRITDKSSDDDADQPPAPKRLPKPKPTPGQTSPPPRLSAKKAQRQLSMSLSPLPTGKPAKTVNRTDKSPLQNQIIRPTYDSSDEHDELTGEDILVQLPPPLRGPALASPMRRDPVYSPRRWLPSPSPKRRSNQPPLFRPPSTSTNGDLDEKDQLLKDLEDLQNGYESNEEDRRPESKYGSENEPSPAGSQAHEANEPSDDGQGEMEDLTDSIAL